VNYVTQEKTQRNSAYVRVKLFKKPVIVKMLVDSGNLVSDLVSEEFARQVGAKFDPVQKRVGTAAKGGSVNIVGRCRPFKLFIENLSQAVEIRAFVVKELSHPINMGQEFMGRYQGWLEFSPTQGWLEIQGQKTALIDKRAALHSDAVTDERLLKVLRQPTLQGYSVPEMVLEGAIHHLGGDEYRNIPVVSS